MADDADAQQPVTVSLRELEARSVSFPTLHDAFGPTSLGILIVKDLPPEYPVLRTRLLSLASYLGNLPQEELERLECPAAKWLVGWSCGKETLKNGVYDTLKGSYYVNCGDIYQHSTPQAASDSTQSSDSASAFPEHTAPNIWPSPTILPHFQDTFESLCRIVIDVAALVARALDRYAEKDIQGYGDMGFGLERMVRNSRTSKARLLHYFPPPDQRGMAESKDETEEDDQDNWCATHLDHGCLTGLTAALYVNEALPLPALPSSDTSTSEPSTWNPSLPASHPPDPNTGLYIRSRTGITTRVSIPADCLAFQTGEALELITRGRFRAVPHFVRVASCGKGKVARNTLAVFTQPDLHEMVDEKRDYATFAKEVIERNH
ncbi:MAG: hypothetical protein M1817_000272 [Caeruleum heppii]|nr:MAG: hypothetical protein M1817_000272 [Caeruleum heppii]